MSNTQTTARGHILVFAMGAMALVTLATTVIVGAHYWQMLSGVFLIAILGLCLPDWAAWWSTYWHAKATKDGNEDTAVKWTSLAVSAVMSLVMLVNAGAVLAVWWDSEKATAAHVQISKATTDLQTSRSAGTTDAIKARGQVVQQMKAVGASERTIREYLKTEADRDKIKSLTADAPKEAATAVAYVSMVPEPVQKYMAFYVYVVPGIIGLLGIFAIIIAVSLPGGVEFTSANGSEFPSEINANGKSGNRPSPF